MAKQVANKYMKSCSPSIIIRKYESKSQLNITCLDSLIKIQTIASLGEDVEKKEPSCTVDGNVNWCESNMGNSMEVL